MRNLENASNPKMQNDKNIKLLLWVLIGKISLHYYLVVSLIHVWTVLFLKLCFCQLDKKLISVFFSLWNHRDNKKKKKKVTKFTKKNHVFPKQTQRDGPDETVNPLINNFSPFFLVLSFYSFNFDICIFHFWFY